MWRLQEVFNSIFRGIISPLVWGYFSLLHVSTTQKSNLAIVGQKSPMVTSPRKGRRHEARYPPEAGWHSHNHEDHVMTMSSSFRRINEHCPASLRMFPVLRAFVWNRSTLSLCWLLGSWLGSLVSCRLNRTSRVLPWGNLQGSLKVPKMEFFYKSSYLRFEFFISMQNWVFYKKR